MKKVLWVFLAVAIAVAGTIGYGALVRQENDTGRPLRLLAVAEEQRLELSFSRSGRILTPVPDEGETITAGAEVTRIDQPGLEQDAADLARQVDQVRARERTRREEVARLQAERAQIQSDERRVGKLVKDGIAPKAELESLMHRREAVEAGIRGRESEQGELDAEEKALEARREKLKTFGREGILLAPATGVVLTRHHREGEWLEAGQPVLTLQVEAPYLRAEVPEERLSVFTVGRSVWVFPQTRPNDRTKARVVSIKPRSEYATRRNWGLQNRDLKTFSVRLALDGNQAISGQTFVVEAGPPVVR
jgi:multidrug resistance efflux pump